MWISDQLRRKLPAGSILLDPGDIYLQGVFCRFHEYAGGDSGSMSALDIALLFGGPDDVNYWLKREGRERVQAIPGTWSILHSAALADYGEVVKKLIELGSKVNCRDGEGRTPLRVALDVEACDAALALLENGARL
jgi:ankyrin repeat protein